VLARQTRRTASRRDSRRAAGRALPRLP
jgi:hypothetical protein